MELGATLYPNLQLNGYRCAEILSKMPFSRTAVPELRQKRAQHSVLDKRISGLLFWQYTLVKKQRKLSQSAFRIAPQQAQANLCEPSDLARTDWLELMAVIFARVGVNLKRIPKARRYSIYGPYTILTCFEVPLCVSQSTQIPCVSPLLHILVR